METATTTVTVQLSKQPNDAFIYGITFKDKVGNKTHTFKRFYTSYDKAYKAYLEYKDLYGNATLPEVTILRLE